MLGRIRDAEGRRSQHMDVRLQSSSPGASNKESGGGVRPRATHRGAGTTKVAGTWSLGGISLH